MGSPLPPTDHSPDIFLKTPSAAVRIKPPPPHEIVSQLALETGLPDAAIRLLLNRGYQTRDEIVRFLEPELAHLNDPFLLGDMEKAADRVLRAIDSGELITLWGDYDADGVTGVALLHRTLSQLGGRLRCYVPHRRNEGYGLSERGILEARSAGSTLIITVDCGVTEIAEVQLAARQGIDVVVTDHHLPGSVLPPAFAILDPKLEGENYPFRELAGVGVAFKLVQALWSRRHLPSDALREDLDLVALGTVADVVPLIDENRVLSRVGIKKLNRTKKTGLKNLIELSKLSDRRIDSRQILFGLAPRLNAAGRMDEGRKAVQLLISEDEDEAAELARELDTLNSQRRGVEMRIFSEAVSMVEEAGQEEDPVLVLAKDGWHPGVIGICASKIADKYWRPTVMIALEGEEGKGSARSIPSFHIYEALSECEEDLREFGGHRQAAGLSIDRKNIERFADRLRDIASRELTAGDLMRETLADLELSFGEIDEELPKLLRLFTPHGVSNPAPLFLTRGTEAVGTPRLVGTNHLKLKLRHQDKVLPAIGFSLGRLIEEIEIAKPDLGVVYSIGEDDFTGTRKVVLKMKDLWSERSIELVQPNPSEEPRES